MKTSIFRLVGAIIIMLAFAAPAHAGSSVLRTDFINVNMWASISSTPETYRSMSFSVWDNHTVDTVRYGGQPNVYKYGAAGYCFFITTCPSGGGECTTDKRICGDLAEGDVVFMGDTFHLAAGGFIFDCGVDRRANSSSNRHNTQFNGSSNEEHFKTRSTEGQGTLSGIEGTFFGYCYGNKGFSKTKTVD
ncbi:MAG: hypothetical protein AAB367_00730 [Patescibacteria group bacterium]